MPVFFDTNVVLYAAVQEDAAKTPVALSLLNQHAETNDGVVSTQVLQETYVNAAGKFGWQAERTEELIQNLLSFDVVASSASFVLAAIALSRLAQLSVWDALIVNAAAEARCTVLYTEDLNHGQVISGVRIVNPFKEKEPA